MQELEPTGFSGPSLVSINQFFRMSIPKFKFAGFEICRISCPTLISRKQNSNVKFAEMQAYRFSFPTLACKTSIFNSRIEHLQDLKSTRLSIIGFRKV